MARTGTDYNNLVPRVSPLPAPWNEREGAGRGETLGTRLKRRDPGNEVEEERPWERGCGLQLEKFGRLFSSLRLHMFSKNQY